MKTLIVILLLATSLSAQYANKIESTTLVATHKVVGSDTISGKWILTISEEWGGANHRMVYNGEFLYRKDGAYRNKNTSVKFDQDNNRIEVKTKDEIYYLIRKEDQ